MRNIFIFIQVFLLCLECPLNDGLTELQSEETKGQHSGLYQGPYFSGVSLPSVLNITATQGGIFSNIFENIFNEIFGGQTVHLPCNVKQLGENSLAWVRSSDSKILSIDSDIVTHDKRLGIVESDNRQDWVLIIRSVTAADAGSYECQISTEVKMSRFVHVKIIVPVTVIAGAPDIYAKSGSSVEITCSVTDASVSSLIWYKDGSIIPIEDWEDVDVQITKDKKKIYSILKIQNLSHHKHGIYSCRSSGLSLQNVTLHVLDAKEQGLRTSSVDSSVKRGVLIVVSSVIVVIKIVLQ